MLWIWPVVIVTLVSVMAFLVSSEVAASTRGRVHRSFACPTTGREVAVLFESDFFEPGYFRDVISCSRFGGRPRCSLACLELSKEVLAGEDRRRARAVGA